MELWIGFSLGSSNNKIYINPQDPKAGQSIIPGLENTGVMEWGVGGALTGVVDIAQQK